MISVTDRRAQQFKVPVEAFELGREGVYIRRELHKLVFPQVQIHSQFRAKFADDVESFQHVFCFTCDDSIIQVPLVKLQARDLFGDCCDDFMNNQTEQSWAEWVPLLYAFL